jgi:hypothetical protein
MRTGGFVIDIHAMDPSVIYAAPIKSGGASAAKRFEEDDMYDAITKLCTYLSTQHYIRQLIESPHILLPNGLQLSKARDEAANL